MENNDLSLDQSALIAEMSKLYKSETEEVKEVITETKKEVITENKDDDEDDDIDDEGDKDKKPTGDENKDVLKAKREAKNKYLPQISKIAKERDELKAKLESMSKKSGDDDQSQKGLTPEQVKDMIELSLKETDLTRTIDKSERYFYKKNETFKNDTEFQSYVEFYKEKYPTMSLDEVKNIYVGENLSKFKTEDEHKAIDISGNAPTFKEVEKKLTDFEIRDMALEEFLKQNRK